MHKKGSGANNIFFKILFVIFLNFYINYNEPDIKRIDMIILIRLDRMTI